MKRGMVQQRPLLGYWLPFIGFTTRNISHDCDDWECMLSHLTVRGFLVEWLGYGMWIKATITPHFGEDNEPF